MCMNMNVGVTPYILTYNVFAYTTRLCVALCRRALHKSDNVVVVVAAAAAVVVVVVVVVSIIFHYYNHHHHHGYVSEHLPTEQRSCDGLRLFFFFSVGVSKPLT